MPKYDFALFFVKSYNKKINIGSYKMENIIKTFKSEVDKSVNFVYDASQIGMFEARYVRRENDYFIVYLSSQSGCDQACRMCHLTATGQNKYENATLQDFLLQAEQVYSHYDEQNPAKLVHYNFMARGEALNNKLILENSGLLLSQLSDMASKRNLESKFLISTILPQSIGTMTLKDIFPSIHPEIYYSIYSMNPSFRKRWLARAFSAEKGLDMLKEWQDSTGKIPKIHFAFIKGENDSEKDMQEIGEAINSRDLKVNLNIVRYNPYSDKYGQESDEPVILRNTEILKELLKPEQMRIVPKVGFDVKASCGMFIK